MRDAKSINEEVRHFYSERAIIEDEYAQRLLTLTQRNLGTAEIGTLKTSLQMLVTETQKIATSHATIAKQLKTDLVITHTRAAEEMLRKRRKVGSRCRCFPDGDQQTLIES